MFTTEARSFANRPSGRSGWVRYSTSVMITPSTESPRNSRRSLVGRPPFSYAKDRWVSASTTNSSSSSTPSAALMASGSGVLFGVPEPAATRDQTPTTWRPRYCPQVAQTWCGGVIAPHARFGQVTRVGALVFHCERRERVLLRDIFLFGTATIDLLLVTRRTRHAAGPSSRVKLAVIWHCQICPAERPSEGPVSHANDRARDHRSAHRTGRRARDSPAGTAAPTAAPAPPRP